MPASGANVETLFCRMDMFSVLDFQRKQATKEINGIEANRLLNTPTDDLVGYIVQKYQLEVPELLRGQAYLDEPMEVRIPMNDFGRHIEVQGTLVQLTVPFTGDRQMFFVRPNTFDTAPPRARVDEKTIVIAASGVELKPEAVKAGLERALGEIEKYLGWQRASSQEFNADLARLARSSVESRKRDLLRDRNLVADLGFPIRARPEAAKTYASPVRRKIELSPPPASTAPFSPEPTLDDTSYRHILSAIENMALTMERSPTAFSGMGEEDIRQQFLVPLNGMFEGAASGETFNFQGKTDILIRSGGKNLFIAECKFWSGEKGFSQTIDQVLGYLSWRDTKAAIILFNRNKDFSRVLESVKSITNTHVNKKRGPVQESETRFRYVFGNPSDGSRELFLTILAFDMPRAVGPKITAFGP